MNFGIPRGRRDAEYRVGLIPAGVRLLTQAGHTCYIEHDAGIGSSFIDHSYESAGGKICYSGDEVYGRADVILTISPPTLDEYSWMRPGQTIMGFLSLAAANPTVVRIMQEKGINAIGYEIIQDDNGRLTVLHHGSQVAGHLVAQVAALLLQNDHGGKGILLGGVPGVPPAEVVILGAGTVGTAAAQTFLGMGATVYVLDRDLNRLEELDAMLHGRIITMVAHDFNIAKVCRFADVLVGAVLVPGARAPILVTREMVRSMRPKSIIMDISIDQGGCIETSHPTTHSNPTFIEEGIMHYCVPNMTSIIGRTTTHALNNAYWPYIQLIASNGIDTAISLDKSLARGVYLFHGEIVHPFLQAAFDSRRTSE